MTTQAIRTCTVCGDVRPVRHENDQPVTRMCRTCAARNNVRRMHEANLANPPQPRPIDPMVVDMLVLGIPEHASVAERIAAISRLSQRELSAKELARRFGVSSRSIHRYRARMRAS